MRGNVPLLLAAALAACGGPSGPTTPEPDVRARPTADGLVIDVPGTTTYRECEWEINGDYRLGGNFDLEPGQVVQPFSGFVNNAGRRFVWPGDRLEVLVIDCNGSPRTYQRFTW